MRLVVLTDMRALDPVELPVLTVSQDIQHPAVVDAHIADASELITEEALLG
jgi:hypothetical protein